MSCDLLPSERRGPHHVGDVLVLIGTMPDYHWDLMVAHPPCTYLTRSGARWWKGRQREQEEALEFVRQLLCAPISRIALENPPGAIGTQIRPADQYIQPWMFGHPQKKMTGLLLKNLPLLVPTRDVRSDMALLPEKERSACHYAKPGPDRWKARSRTLEGVAKAMSEQWGMEESE